MRFHLEVPPAARALVILIDVSLWVAEVLSDEGFAVCGFSSSRLDDLHAAVRHCQTRAALPIFLVGHEAGAALAILGANDVHNLRGIVAWKAKADSGVEAAAAKLKVPLLLINGAEIAAPETSRVVMKESDNSKLAADLTARFIGAYS